MAKKNLSLLESGAGLFQGLVTGLMDIVRTTGVPFEAIYRLVTPEGRETLEKMVAVAFDDYHATLAKSLVAKPMISGTTERRFEIVVDPTQSFEQMRDAGKYDFKNPDITEERFPTKGTAAGKRLAALVNFDREMADEENESVVNAELDRMGWKRANTAETFAFGAQHPELQRKYFIASGAFWTLPDGAREFLCLDLGRIGRSLSLGWLHLSLRWAPDVRFLVVRK